MPLNAASVGRSKSFVSKNKGISACDIQRECVSFVSAEVSGRGCHRCRNTQLMGVSRPSPTASQFLDLRPHHPWALSSTTQLSSGILSHAQSSMREDRRRARGQRVKVQVQQKAETRSMYRHIYQTVCINTRLLLQHVCFYVNLYLTDIDFKFIGEKWILYQCYSSK